jgi:hypothetical protein
MSGPVAPLEVVSRVPPLALRFRDTLFGATVGDDLQVTARPGTSTVGQRSADVGPSGVHTFHALPGLVALPAPPASPRRPVQFGSGDAGYWSTLPAPRPFHVEVRDPRGRFLPLAFEAAAPTRGLFQPPCLAGAGGSPSSPPELDGSIPLFSAPTRQVATPVAVVRMDLWDQAAGAPAAWALVQGRLAAGPWHQGLADARGRLVLFLPYPPPDDPFTSPPASFVPGMGPPLTDQTWTLDLQAFYAPQAPAPDLPDLCAALAQPPVTLWGSFAGRVPLAAPPLRFGEVLTIRSVDAGPPAGAIRVSP